MTINELTLIQKELKELYLTDENILTFGIAPPDTIYIYTHQDKDYSNVIPEYFKGANIIVKHMGVIETNTRVTAFTRYVDKRLQESPIFKKAYDSMTKKLIKKGLIK